MPDIKTRDVVSGTIKTIDRSTLAGQRMKDAYVQAKDKAEHSVYASESTSEEYATNQMADGVSTVTREAVHQVDVQGHRIIQGAQRKFTQRQENSQPQQSPPQSTSGSPQSSPNTPASISPQQVQNSLGTEDIHHAQQPHRVSPDGAVSSGMGGYSEVGSGTSIPKQEAVHQQQIASAKVELRAKRASRQTLSSVSHAPSEGKVFHSRHVPIARTTATGRTVKSVENITIKTSERTIKTAGSTVKTVEHMGDTAIKSTQAAAEIAQKTAVIAAKTAHRSHIAAKSAATVARKAADYTARAAKAIAQAIQELISVVATGGGTVLILVIVLVVMCFAGMMLASDENDMEILPVSEEVKAYEPIIQKYAKEHGIPDYVLLIEAVMMLESGGRGTDPMQCSECNFNTLYPHTPGSITDPEYSINVGIQNLADCLQIAECESPVDMDAIKLALQGYNYGQGYITWAINKYGEYSKANAIEFSLKTAEAYGWDSYGDMDYVPHVLRYYPLG
ncbi:MAG: lysozyme family protein, partial [Faecousia sp.]